MKEEEKYQWAAWLDDQVSDAELEQLRQDPDYAVMEKIKSYTAALRTPEFEEDALLLRIQNQQRQKGKVRRFFVKQTLQWAALLLVFLGISLGYMMTRTESEMTGSGESVSFQLPDASEVQLHAGSELSYKTWNWDSNRLVSLEGEAYFKVAKGKRFEVKTSQGTVSVLGTQFNVKVRGNRLEVTCFEGKVQVATPSEKIILTPGKTLAYDQQKRLFFHTTNALQPAWIAKELAFEKERPQEVLAELERHFDLTIKAGAFPKNELFTGKLPGDNSEAALQLLAHSYHFKVVKINDRTYSLDATP
ncbi:FecR family protein [Flavobacterium sp.]|jgi:transmembrane sensor|uniref:FecR family protein n=1 Tax=Flavobacterium sp. TaxID=239 RepID=UPI0022C6A07B|nr:FecR domain-containing protein [Flavobacterium sp.]MCZ8145717.1 FecR domain-containing protein [Flavobacterium sp.]MCZ8367358.1 FecR domain-containing protein [Flavobacterium sp.]